MARHRVVIVGSGFGGLAAAQELAKADVEITLIDRRNHHLFQPLLYQVATAALSPSEIAWPIRNIVRRRRNIRTLLAEVTGVDPAAGTVILEDGSSLLYDSLILATGARHAYFGHDAWEEFAPGLKTLEDATTIRRKLLLSFEAAEREADPAARRALLTFAIIGAGPTGVEMAGAIVDLARETLRGEFHMADPAKARVVLIEAGPRVLGNFREELSDYTLKSLRRMGVEVILGEAVTSIDAKGLVYGGTRLDAECVIWAAGVQASPAARWLGVEADRSGRVKVNIDLSVPGRQNVFVVGDTASITRPDGKPVPGVGDAAKQEGKHAAGVIRARLAGAHAEISFRYKHRGDLATIGKRSAVIDFGWIRLTGWLAWWVWGLAHIYFLINLRHRLSVAVSWLWIYLSGQRGARLITQDEAAAEGAPARTDR
ncbi:MAG TPA: NAD(P)/FAD-dependent oxidoreductase [Devosia sp.]|jgi:NADH dehydrogenase|nr:NAD(P)/FAD-dependent oxidoreductase [Devosia sp.]